MELKKDVDAYYDGNSLYAAHIIYSIMFWGGIGLFAIGIFFIIYPEASIPLIGLGISLFLEALGLKLIIIIAKLFYAIAYEKGYNEKSIMTLLLFFPPIGYTAVVALPKKEAVIQEQIAPRNVVSSTTEELKGFNLGKNEPSATPKTEFDVVVGCEKSVSDFISIQMDDGYTKRVSKDCTQSFKLSKGKHEFTVYKGSKTNSFCFYVDNDCSITLGTMYGTPIVTDAVGCTCFIK